MVNITEVNADSWDEEVLKSDILTAVDFWHDRCPWCIKLNPIFEEVASEYESKVKSVKFNVLGDPGNMEIAVRYGIMSTPTLVFFCEGKPVSQHLGFAQKEQLHKMFDELLDKHRKCVKQSTELK